jgi:hypothetical protein
MIADRLGQAAVASPTDKSRLLQARALFRLAPSLDRDYLRRRVVQEAATWPISRRISAVVRVKLDQLLAAIEARKVAIGTRDTPETTDALRNKGARRTPEKRELLKRMEDRTRAAGREPVRAYC